jgi:hypothetical protein
MERGLKLYISNILLLYLWCVLNNVVSYTEELALSLIYVVLFIIISEKSRDVIRKMMVTQTLKLMSCYEQLLYLKVKIMVKSLKLLKILLQRKYIKSIINIVNFEIKRKRQNYIDNKRKIYKIQKVYYLFFFLLSKIYR